ncbi:GntR family transcriptional regulator [Curtobacterium flaccumfaciens]|uniref:GntR family transcriptional regulator n=1 Tax=Curtobacterium flaccumfaciens TaxID=2035 RepID=A0A4R6DGH8_9MICO|nr:GntR family transcriptional regulator [Curtobacterium flaccumfaciens]TDN43129.1 GntR family transcriptional regulator [Curtobacterium flaccumfaciens]
MLTHYRLIAADVADRILRDEFDPERPLPSEHALAADYGVARGTIRNALTQLRAQGVLDARPGSRWRITTAEQSQDPGRLESFAQWARARGLNPGGQVVSVDEVVATVVERRRLRAEPGERVLHVTRIRSLDGRDVMVERSTYPAWMAEIIRSMPDWQSSVAAAMEDRFGVTIASAESTIDAVAASAADAAYLRVPEGSPLLRSLRLSAGADGRPIELGDDRYVAGAVAFRVHSGPHASH